MQTAAQDTVSFNITSDERELIEKITNRAFLTERKYRPVRHCRKRLEIEMDIAATHANGNPLRLADLLAADDFNFAHDVFGIERHLNRTNGRLEGFFRPRFSQPQSQSA